MQVRGYLSLAPVRFLIMGVIQVQVRRLDHRCRFTLLHSFSFAIYILHSP